jgi:hypothetical protein
MPRLLRQAPDAGNELLRIIATTTNRPLQTHDERDDDDEDYEEEDDVD